MAIALALAAGGAVLPIVGGMAWRRAEPRAGSIAVLATMSVVAVWMVWVAGL
jgi:hypothetical protein